jgi:hypothetical protein
MPTSPKQMSLLREMVKTEIEKRRRPMATTTTTTCHWLVLPLLVLLL